MISKGSIKGFLGIVLALGALAGLLSMSAGSALAAAPNWDTRACYATPNDSNCTGKLPVAPLSIPAQTQKNSGSGTCLNGATQSITQPITETIGISGGGTQTQTIGTLTLWWLQSCESFAAKVSIPQPPLGTVGSDTLHINPTVKVTITAHDTDTSQDHSPLDNFLGIQHWFSHDQSTGPIASYDTWTPMIFSPNDSGSVFSACTSITFESGLSYAPNCVAASESNGKLNTHPMIDAWIHV